MAFKVATWNCNGLDKEMKLIKFFGKTLKNQKKDSCIFCFQEIKTEQLNKNIERCLLFFNFSYDFQPSCGKSGGLLTIWTNNLESFLLFRNEACLISKFPKQNVITISTDIRKMEYIKFCQVLRDGVIFILTGDHPETTVLLMGDLNAYNNVKQDRKGAQTTGTISKDNHLMVFRKVIPIIEELLLDDAAVTGKRRAPTHTCKKTGTDTRIDYIFTNKTDLIENFIMHDRDLSDHSILEIHLKAPFSMEIGPGVWRLNNNILDKNHKVISELIGSVLKLNISYDAKNSCCVTPSEALASIEIESEEHTDKGYSRQ